MIMSTGSLSASNQDGLLAHVGRPASQRLRSSDDRGSLILCSLAKSRPACRRRGCDRDSSQEPARLSVSSAALEPAIDEEEMVEEEEDVDEEEYEDEQPIVSSPVDEHIELPYEEITESFRKDINQMMKYDTLVNSMVTDKSVRQQRPPTSRGSRVTESPVRYASTATSRVTEKDMERLREFVRMDRGLPLTRDEKRKPVQFRKEPRVRPKMNRATAIRTQHIRKCSLTWSSRSSFDLDASMSTRQQEMMKRLKKLVTRFRLSGDRPLYKYNKGFEMRYLSNKGNPLMPSSFRDSYEAYNKPLFTMPRKLSLPRRYLWPEYKKNQISYLGLRIDADAAPPQYQEKKTVKQKRTRKLARPPVRKAQRVVRVRPTLSPKPRKAPWNYGMFERTSKRLEFH